jgi:hypothetical protein
MKQRSLQETSKRLANLSYLVGAVLSILFICCGNIIAQTSEPNSEHAAYVKNAPPQQAVVAPVLKEYRNVKIGEPAETLRELWGKPKMEYPDGLLYEPSDSETIQIAIGPDKKITAISITFADGKGAPSFADVFGTAAVPERRENGSVYKLVRYPDAGYWVAYYAGPPDKADVTLTMQKL